MSKPKFDPEIVELFRSALMKKYSNEWDMDTVANAAYTCAEAIQPRIEMWIDILEKRPGKPNKYQAKSHLKSRL